MSNVLEKQVYAAILAVLNDRNSYYQSNVGKKGEYNHFNEGGKEAIMNFVETFAPLMLKQQDLELNERSKKIMLEELKK
jgi:hypothetical protein